MTSYWYHGSPNITTRITEIVPDPDISYEKMKSGEIDTGVITPENLAEARKLDNVTVYEWWPAAAQWSYVGMNMRSEGKPTTDINVRHGLSYALDKDLMTEEIMEGKATRQCSVFPETSWAYTSDVECYDYDAERRLPSLPSPAIPMTSKRHHAHPRRRATGFEVVYGPNTSKTLELNRSVAARQFGRYRHSG